MALGRAGRYELIRELGKSTHDAVYKAVDTATPKADSTKQKTVAVRKIEPDAPNVQALRDHLRSAQKLDSPNIAQVFQIIDEDGSCCAAMEYVEGNLLRLLLAKNNTHWDVVDVARQICSAIDHARSRQLAHTNFTPANIMVEWDGTIKVMDYGLLTDPGESAQAGRNPDALHYLSPEQAKGEPPSWHSNLFSLGVILYEMAAGVRPFAGQDAATLLDSICSVDPVPPHSINPKVTPQISAAILKALAKLPEDRYSSGAELVRALEFRQPEAPPAPVVAPPKPVESTPPAVADSARKDETAQTPVVAPALRVAASPVERACQPAQGAGTRKLDVAVAVPATNQHPAIAVTPAPVCTGARESSAAEVKPAEAPPASVATVDAMVEPREFVIVGPRAAQPVPTVPKPAVAASRWPVLKKRPFWLAGAAAIVVLAAFAAGYAVRPPNDAEDEQPPTQAVPTQAAVKEVVTTAPPEAEPQAELVSTAPSLRARKRAPKPVSATVVPVITTGQLTVDSSPRGAMVELDGQSGSSLVTPCTMANISAGRHTLTLRKEGYAAESRPVDITAGQNFSATLALRELGSTLTIFSDPPGATVLIDSRDTGKATPLTVTVPKGKRTVSLQKSGFLPVTQTVDLMAGQTLSIRPRLLPTGNTAEIKPVGKFGRMFGRGVAATLGTLKIRTNPKGAQIMINERMMDKTTPAELATPAGSYEITLIYPGYKRLRRTVTVVAGFATTIDESFQP